MERKKGCNYRNSIEGRPSIAASHSYADRRHAASRRKKWTKLVSGQSKCGVVRLSIPVSAISRRVLGSVLRLIREAMPNTKLQMLLRGQNIVGYHNYPDDAVVRFIEKSAENGIDVFRVFDAMNDIRNMQTSIEAVKRTGKTLEAAISYTISPVHSVDYFVERAEKLAEAGTDILCIKDMAGLLSPYVAHSLVSKLKERLDVPIHLHSHCTTGMAQMAYIMAIEAGVDIVDTAISTLSQGTSQPATEAVVVALKGTPRDTGLDLGLLAEIADYFSAVRSKYSEFESPITNKVSADIVESQIPGGMLSNLVAQLRQQKAEHRLAEVLKEVQTVRKEMGYPPLVTPTSQMVGSQATLNVLTGKRYGIVTMEVRNYVMGHYGEAPGPVDEAIKKMVLGKKSPITCRPADLLKPMLEDARKEIGDLATTEEDLISYTIFPDITKDYLMSRTA